MIFDVDGVLLELTVDEEELFFEPFKSRMDATKLSRDWNSYKFRNDEEIMREICAKRGFDHHEITGEYLALLRSKLNSKAVVSKPIRGARLLIDHLKDKLHLGVATANFREAAKMRLKQAGLWQAVAALAFGADGGGHKSDILARAIAAADLPPEKIIFIGDNVNDVEAGSRNGAKFVGFSLDESRRKMLKNAGALAVSASHSETLRLIRTMLG